MLVVVPRVLVLVQVAVVAAAVVVVEVAVAVAAAAAVVLLLLLSSLAAKLFCNHYFVGLFLLKLNDPLQKAKLTTIFCEHHKKFGFKRAHFLISGSAL